MTESQVGTATWQAAFDHNLSIIFDLAMGGGYPDGVCGCTSPTSATTSGGTMSVAYVAAYETSRQLDRVAAACTGPITGYGGLCIDDRGGQHGQLQPGPGVHLQRDRGPAVDRGRRRAARCTSLGKCMDINGGGTADGTTVDLYDCNNTGAQVFIPESNGSLYNPQSGKCLDDTNWSTTPGTQLQIWDCTGNANQQWTLP